MRIMFSVVPLLVLVASIAGIVVLTLGIRGRPVFALPRCRKCGYDLRNMQFMSEEIGNCPECGSPLSAANGVTFGRWQRRPKQIVIGLLLLAMPWAAAFAAAYGFRRYAAPVGGPMGTASQTTPALLASLPANLTTPWHWQELENRLKAGKLTQADVDAAFAVLVKDLNAQRAAGKDRQPLHWVDGFVKSAISSNSVSQAQLDALCKAYYGSAPKLTMRDLAREGEPIQVDMEHESWDLPNMIRCYWLSDVVADGTTKLAPRPRHQNERTPVAPDALSSGGGGGDLDLHVPHALPPGEHELTFTFEVGVISQQATMRGTDGRPGTPDKWPSPISRWQASVKRKVTVKPKDAQLLKLVTDPASDPFKSTPLTIEQALIRPSSRGVELAVRWKTAGTPPLCVSYRVRAQLGDQKVDCGTILAGQAGRMSFSSSSELHGRLTSLPPDVKLVHFTLEPYPKAAEHYSEVEEVWGQPLEIKDVSLERYDLTPPPPP